MARAYGSGSKLAFMRGASGQAWGTGTIPTLATGHRWPFKSYTVDAIRDSVGDDSITGNAERARPQYTNKRTAGSLVAIMDPRQLPAVLSAMLLGTAGAPTALSGADTGAYAHLLKFGVQSTQEGLWGTAGIDDLADCFNHSYLKVGRRIITGRTGGYLEAGFDLLGRGEDRSLNSSSWTYANSPVGDGGRLLLMRQLALKVNASAGGALGAGDAFYPVSFELEVTRQNAEDYAQQGESEEPLPSDFAEISLRLTFSQETTELLTLFRTNRDSAGNGAALKASLVVTGDQLIVGGGAQYFAWHAYLPNLHIVEVARSVDGPGPVPFRVSLSAHAIGTVPTGFTAGYTSALQELWYNDRSTDLLA